MSLFLHEWKKFREFRLLCRLGIFIIHSSKRIFFKSGDTDNRTVNLIRAFKYSISKRR